MEVIDELESSPRQVFTRRDRLRVARPRGSSSASSIRTFEMHDGRIWLDVGGGIVADSDPDAEAVEALTKARPLMESIGASRPSFVAGSAPQPLRLSARAARRPDACGGLLETIKVVGGAPVFGELHLARLEASMRELYGMALPAMIDREMAEAAAGAGRLRLLADRDGRVVLDPGPAVAAVTAEAIEPVTVPGGLGAHKWRDRRWIDALADAVAPAHPLLVDLDGLVLEAGAAAVLAVIGGTLVAPPLDGRILPSVTRTVALRRARAAGVSVAIRPLLLDEMSSASEVILASALRGIRACGASGPVTAAIVDRAPVAPAPWAASR